MPFGFGKSNVQKMKEKRDVEGLIKVLSYEKDYVVRLNATLALGDIGDSRAVEPLIHELGATDTPGWAAEALRKIGEPAVEPLIRALNDSNSRVRVGSVLALGKIGNSRAVEPLIAALNDTEQSVRKTAAKALPKIRDTLPDALQQARVSHA